MDLLKACDELKAIVHTAELVVRTYEEDPDNYSAIKEYLEELASEFKRVGGGSSANQS
mgnify:CR=1 FL=1|jgi:ribosome-associated translation inhibitor RaiA